MGVKFTIYQIVSIVITCALFCLILALTIWAAESSKVKNCCKNETTFVNCKKYFGSQSNMTDKTYQEVCSKEQYQYSNNVPQIEIITLIKDKKRLQNAKSIKGKNVNIFEAVDKDDYEKMSKLSHQYNLKIPDAMEHADGTRACLLSHILVIEKFLSSPSKYLIVLEDDFKIIKGLPKTYNSIEAMFAEIDQKPENVDILYLNDRYQYNNNYRIIGGVGCEGYILTKHGAQKIYSFLKHGCSKPIDDKLSSHCQLQEESDHIYRRNNKTDIITNCFKSKDIYVTSNERAGFTSARKD